LKKAQDENKDQDFDLTNEIEPAEVLISLIVPAYNEQNRLTGMLEEAVNHLESNYSALKPTSTPNGNVRQRTSPSHSAPLSGWEILLVNDGSTDATLGTCTTFMKNHMLPPPPIRRASGPWTHHSDTDGVRISSGSIRMITLEQNRGKGGAVTHGLRHARGQYVLFADADGASKFDDIDKLISACGKCEDKQGRGVAVGSRAHLVGTTAVVQRSALRNFLMHSFHLLLWIMTPPATARIRDTQCGFKMFSRQSLPFIVPHMHTEGWIFDVEMLMLAEFANIPVVEVAVGWREVAGSKLNVLQDSLGMAWGLFVLRVCWGLGIFRR
jgi:dolichyl-phosphate beta-glucosyltransferase